MACGNCRCIMPCDRLAFQETDVGPDETSVWLEREHELDLVTFGEIPSFPVELEDIERIDQAAWWGP
jgi:hypothetical protein